MKGLYNTELVQEGSDYNRPWIADEYFALSQGLDQPDKRTIHLQTGRLDEIG